MVDLVNDRLVPVWINIRTSPIPNVPAIDESLGSVKLDETRRVAGGFSQGFFVRSLVLSHDVRFLLNPQANDDPMRTFQVKGHFPYAQVKTDDYLPMLNDALARTGGARPGY